MHIIRFVRHTGLALALAGLGLPALAEKGAIGFAVAISADSFFNPVVEKAEIKSVRAGSAAELAGLLAGDLITQIEDCAIPGCPGSRAKELMNKDVGQPLHLKIKRGEQAEHEVTVILGKRAE